jgi:deoxyuridine 5'-triphosphate nucleotidohydrolase
MTIEEYLEQNNVTLEQCTALSFVKTHPDAQLPVRKHDNLAYGDTGYDVTAVESVTIPARSAAIVPTGLTLANLPAGIWIRIESRSGLAFKHNIQAFNGIIDNNYRGDLGVKLINHSDTDYTVNKGDRIAQLVLYPLVAVVRSEFTDTVTETDRGASGFGSTGR